MRQIRIAAIGGSLRSESVSEQALRACRALAVDAGAEVTVLSGADLVLPPYDPDVRVLVPQARRLLSVLRAADGVLLASPTYHCGMTGLLKNALDHTEALATETPAYLDGRVVGCLAVAWNEVAGSTALGSMRATVHALRGWTTPMGAVVPAGTDFEGDRCTDARAARRLEILTHQVVDFARMRVAQHAAEREPDNAATPMAG